MLRNISELLARLKIKKMNVEYLVDLIVARPVGMSIGGSNGRSVDFIVLQEVIRSFLIRLKGL